MRLTCDTLSSLPGIAHGFFTREGGKSFGLYASLNCGYGSGDDIAIVAQNRAIVADALGVPVDNLCTAYQIHSPNVVTLSKPWDWEKAEEADALVTATPGIAVAVLAADCLPILFADAKHRVVAAAHAGWKGAVGGVIEATINAMCAAGAQLADIHATIGPGISQESYEVGAEFRERFLTQDKGNDVYFLSSQPTDFDIKKFHFDLKAYAKDRLKKAGVNPINLLANDTCLQENMFFSWRRSYLRGETTYGRLISAIVLE